MTSNMSNCPCGNWPAVITCICFNSLGRGFCNPSLRTNIYHFNATDELAGLLGRVIWWRAHWHCLELTQVYQQNWQCNASKVQLRPKVEGCIVSSQLVLDIKCFHSDGCLEIMSQCQSSPCTISITKTGTGKQTSAGVSGPRQYSRARHHLTPFP